MSSHICFSCLLSIQTGKNKDDPIFQWAQRLRERSGWQKAVVALANKNARILWAVMAREKRFYVYHVSVYASTSMPDLA